MMKLTHNTKLVSILFPAALALALTAGCSEDAANGADASRGEVQTETSPAIERREVTFSVPGMTCPMCPITVRKALAGVDGVLEAHASLDDKQAHVVFDPARTRVDALIAAVNESGFTADPLDEADE